MQANNEPTETVEACPSLATGTWCGDSDVLAPGSPVEVLAVDPAARVSRSILREHGFIAGVPARTACWIRHWPSECDHAQYRSCDLADLDLADEDFDRLAALARPTPASVPADGLVEAIKDGMATLLAVKASASSDDGICSDWRESARHFYGLCDDTIKRMHAALSTNTPANGLADESIAFGNLRDLVSRQQPIRPGTFAYAALIDHLAALLNEGSRAGER